MRFLLEPLIRFDITQMSYRRAETMTDEVIGELATLEAGNETGRPFFLFVNYMDAHDPWQAEFAERVGKRRPLFSTTGK